MATLEPFLRTGELGPLHVGMSRQAVLDVLGTPLDESVNSVWLDFCMEKAYP